MGTLRIGYLGPEGSFSHEAVSTMDNVESIACDTLADLLSSVADSSLDQGLVPIENAIEGRCQPRSTDWSSITSW